MSAGQAWNNARRVLLVDVNNNALVTQPGNADDQPATDMGLVGNSRLYVFDGTSWDRVRTTSDADSTGVFGNGILAAAARNTIFNGATWDRLRGNVEGTLLASAPRTATASSPVQTNHNARGVIVYLNITANPGGAEQLTITICCVDPISGLFGAAMAALQPPAATNALYTMAMYPGLPDGTNFNGGAAGKFEAGVLPRTWYAIVSHSGGGSWTYSLSYSLIV